MEAATCLYSPSYLEEGLCRKPSFREHLAWSEGLLYHPLRRRIQEEDGKDGAGCGAHGVCSVALVLRDSLGNPYEYRVSEAFVVTPESDWVVDPVRCRDMVTLQTCTFPDLVNRLIVRTDRA